MDAWKKSAEDFMQFRELEWVNFLKNNSPKSKNILVGIGDDCALVKAGRQKLLLKSDLFIEGIHFKRKSMSFKSLGMRAVARVLSDFAACGGVPKFIGVSAGFPDYIDKKNLKKILSGIIEYSRKYKFSLVGGDTSRAKELFLDIWGVGEARKFISRSTAKVGDYIFLSGKLGQRKFNAPFSPRVKESQELTRNFKINAMIDISDGFIIDLYRIIEASKKGTVIYQDKIPSKNGERDFYRGEDYELIFTVDSKEKNLNFLEKKFYLIGRVKPESFGYKLRRKTGLFDVKIKGYSHF
ncbi:MAG: thiamine-phosphate kinase [Omnitrophica bacterium]|nr:thiamine-phosphate kinase [Candidatus Omnitrophota bacterium]